MIIRAIVDLPLPLWPTSAVTSPRRSSKLTSLTASVRVTVKPRRRSKTFVTPSTDSTTSLVSALRDSSAVLTNCGPSKPRLASPNLMAPPSSRWRTATWQAARPPCSGTSAGSFSTQSSMRSGQRGAKLQPTMARLRSGGRPGT